MNGLQRGIIAIILGVGTTCGLQWLVSQMGFSDAQIYGAGGLGLIIAGLAVVIGFFKITKKSDDREN